MRTSKFWIIALLLLGLLLGACAKKTDSPAVGGSPQAGSEENGDGNGGSENEVSKGKKNVCEAYKKEDLEAVIGKSIFQASYNDGSADGECNYQVNEDGTEIVAIRFNNDGEAAFQGNKTAFPDHEEVQGVGEKAIWIDGVKVLSFVKDGESWDVQTVSFNNPAYNKDLGIKIAKDVEAKAA